MAGRRCTICTHEKRDEIDRALSHPSRVFTQIAATFRVSPDAVERHHKNHLLPEMREKFGEDLDVRDVDVLAEMKDLFRRMKAHLDRAEDTDNWQAIRAFSSEARQDLELLAKLLGELDERPQVNILVAPQVQYTILSALEPYPEARIAVARALKELEES